MPAGTRLKGATLKLETYFPLYFPAGESVLAKKMPGVEKIKKMREKENKFK